MEISRIYAIVAILVCQISLAHAENAPPQTPELRVEPGMHTSQLVDMDESADGRFLLTVSIDKTARIWSQKDGALVRTLRVPIATGYGGRLMAAAFSSDSSQVAIAGADAYAVQNPNPGQHFVYIYNLQSGKLVDRLGPVNSAIAKLAYSRDGRLAAGTFGRGISVWNLSKPERAAERYDCRADVYGLTFDQSGRLAVSCNDGYVRLYDKALSLVATHGKQGEFPGQIAFDPSGTQLAVGFIQTARVDVLNASDLVHIRTMNPGFPNNDPRVGLGAVAWANDGKTLYAAGNCPDFWGTYRLLSWRMDTFEVQYLGGPRQTVLDLVPVGSGVAFASFDTSIGILNADGEMRFFLKPAISDFFFPNNVPLIKPDASAVLFDTTSFPKTSVEFDVGNLSLTKISDLPDGLLAPIVDTLPIANWQNSFGPTLNGKLLPTGPFETVMSLAIAPDAKSFVLGTHFAIHRFDNRGQPFWQPIQIPGIASHVNLSADGKLIVALLGDGTVRWYRAYDGAELLALFVHVEDQKWVAWTPSGYYAASPGGEDLIGFHQNGRGWTDTPEFFPVALFREKFSRPDVIQRVLQTRDEREAVKQADTASKRNSNTAALQVPAVLTLLSDPLGIETTNGDVTIKYKIESPSGEPVTALRILVNGRPLPINDISTVLPSREIGKENTFRLLLKPGDLIVSMVAFIGEQPSAVSSALVRWPTNAPESAGNSRKLYGLLIGISGYNIPNMDPLQYGDDDAVALAQVLKNQSGLAFSEVELRTLASGEGDKSMRDGEATVANILDGLDWLRKNVGQDDTAIVMFSGHGIVDRGKFYFLPIDADLSRLLSTSIPEATIRDTLSTLNGQVVLFVDACHAGGAFVGLSKNDIVQIGESMRQPDAGVTMFGSSAVDESSAESANAKHGIFTQALLFALGGAADSGAKDRSVDTAELHSYMDQELATLSKDKQSLVYAKPTISKEVVLAKLK